VVNFDPKANGLKGKSISRNGRYSHFALVAAREALADAKIDLSKVDKDRFGVICGSGIGGVEWLEDNVKVRENNYCMNNNSNHNHHNHI
jgi:3-oxoacyl-[acyl-carrier-protein] synthase II